MNRIYASWDPQTELLQTELSGTIAVADVLLWRDRLYQALALIQDNGQFFLWSNLQGYKPANIEAHQMMRPIIPELLISHGMRPAYADLFDESPEIDITLARGIRCLAHATIHHDQTKMSHFECTIAKRNQRFFSDPREAENWLLTFKRSISPGH